MHRLTATILNPRDRQNYDSVLKMCSQEVIDLLKQNVPNSDGTAMYLKLLKNFIDSFMETEISPIERIHKLWYSIFVIRIWRLYLRSESLTVRNHSFTDYCYVCMELNAHSMVRILLFLIENHLPDLFMPWIFNSQSCESFYRLVRSLTTVFARAANCSVKEILERIHKIQLLDDISSSSIKTFTFPRKLKSMTQTSSVKIILPTKTEILEMIQMSKFEAINDAIEIGMLEEGNENLNLECDVRPLHSYKGIRSKKNQPKNRKFKSKSTTGYPFTLSSLLTISLKNYSYKFVDKDVDETSSFVEIYGCKNRMIVKKSSLIWLLRKDPCKLSSDRLERVKSTQYNLRFNSETKRTTKNIKRIKHFRQMRNIKKKCMANKYVYFNK